MQSWKSLWIMDFWHNYPTISKLNWIRTPLTEKSLFNNKWTVVIKIYITLWKNSKDDWKLVWYFFANLFHISFFIYATSFRSSLKLIRNVIWNVNDSQVIWSRCSWFVLFGRFAKTNFRRDPLYLVSLISNVLPCRAPSQQVLLVDLFCQNFTSKVTLRVWNI